MSAANANAEIKFERTIPGKPEDVFYAVSTSQGWRDWLAGELRPTGNQESNTLRELATEEI